MKQSAIFTFGEAEAWYERNKEKLPIKNDPVVEAIKDLKLKPDSIFEVGCSNGWRLNIMKELFPGSHVAGCDPLIDEPNYSHHGKVCLLPGTADALQTRSSGYDMVIYGFCLYLCDPQDYFKIAAEGDRILRDQGHLIIYDFSVDGIIPYKVPYKYKDGVYSHKMHFADMWLWNRSYRMVREYRHGEGDDLIVVTVLRKDRKAAFKEAK